MAARAKIYITGLTILLALVATLFIGLAIGYLQNIRTQAALRSDPVAVNALRAQLSNADQAIIILGDSRVAQWNPLPVIDGNPIIAVGVGGLTAVQLAQAIPNLDFDFDGRTVLVQVGINDLKTLGYTDTSRDAIVRSTTAALQKIASELTAAGAKVVLTTVIPPGPTSLTRRPIWTSETNEATVEVNAHITSDALADVHSIIDFRETLGSPSQIDSRYATDTLHVNAIAYQRLSEAVERSLSSPTHGDS